MSHIRVLDHYPHGTAHGVCYRCRTHQRDLGNDVRERTVDLGVDVDFEGRLFLCETCVVEAGHNLGMLTPDEAAVIVYEATQAAERAAVAEARVAEAEAVLTAWRSLQERAEADTPVDSEADKTGPNIENPQAEGGPSADSAKAKGATKKAAATK